MARNSARKRIRSQLPKPLPPEASQRLHSFHDRVDSLFRTLKRFTAADFLEKFPTCNPVDYGYRSLEHLFTFRGCLSDDNYYTYDERTALKMKAFMVAKKLRKFSKKGFLRSFKSLFVTKKIGPRIRGFRSLEDLLSSIPGLVSMGANMYEMRSNTGISDALPSPIVAGNGAAHNYQLPQFEFSLAKMTRCHSAVDARFCSWRRFTEEQFLNRGYMNFRPQSWGYQSLEHLFVMRGCVPDGIHYTYDERTATERKARILAANLRKFTVSDFCDNFRKFFTTDEILIRGLGFDSIRSLLGSIPDLILAGSDLYEVCSGADLLAWPMMLNGNGAGRETTNEQCHKKAVIGEKEAAEVAKQLRQFTMAEFSHRIRAKGVDIIIDFGISSLNDFILSIPGVEGHSRPGEHKKYVCYNNFMEFPEEMNIAIVLEYDNFLAVASRLTNPFTEFEFHVALANYYKIARETLMIPGKRRVPLFLEVVPGIEYIGNGEYLHFDISSAENQITNEENEVENVEVRRGKRRDPSIEMPQSEPGPKRSKNVVETREKAVGGESTSGVGLQGSGEVPGGIEEGESGEAVQQKLKKAEQRLKEVERELIEAKTQLKKREPVAPMFPGFLPPPLPQFPPLNTEMNNTPPSSLAPAGSSTTPETSNPRNDPGPSTNPNEGVHQAQWKGDQMQQGFTPGPGVPGSGHSLPPQMPQLPDNILDFLGQFIGHGLPTALQQGANPLDLAKKLLEDAYGSHQKPSPQQ